jgi:hypothetical protein
MDTLDLRVMTHTCNPNTWEVKEEDFELEAGLE